jgi:PAS domain S-box-containing protein
MKRTRMEQLRQRALALLTSRQEGSREGAAAILHDMEVLQTELEVQQDELVESQRRTADLAAHYHQLFFNTPLALVLLGERHEIRELNARAAALLCLTPQRLAGSFDQYVSSDDLAVWANATEQVHSRGPLTAELRVRRLGGERRRCVMTLVRHAEGLLLSLEDVTDLRTAETERRIADQRLARVLRDSRDGVVFADADTGLITHLNEALAAALEFDAHELVGRPLVSLFHGPAAVRQELLLRQVTRPGGERARPPTPCELTFTTCSGKLVHTEATVGTLDEGARRFVTLLLRDVSERFRLAAEREEIARMRHQSQKLEALGSLSAGVAHDINNMLTVILGCASAISPAASPVEMHEALEEIRAAARRGRDVTTRLSALVRRQPLRSTAFELAATLRELTTLLRHTVPANIDVVLDLGEGTTLVTGDPGEWHHALLNLAINARDAMPDGGRLTFSTRSTARGLELTVSDTGTGMNPEVLQRAYEPFFTTKPEGAGTGLGLAHVHAVARGHHVTLDCQSTPGGGTTFTLGFPVEAGATLTARPAIEHPRQLTSARVLLVDDDEPARRATRRVLKQLGLVSIDVPSAGQALELLVADQGFDLVLSDLSMPGMDGQALAARVKGQWPDLPFAIITGDLSETRRQELLAAGVREVLHKPFDRDELGALVARTLR